MLVGATQWPHLPLLCTCPFPVRCAYNGLHGAWLTCVLAAVSAAAVPSDDDAKQYVEQLVQQLRSGRRVYLHCSDGNGRTGTIAALLLGALYGLSPAEATERVQRARDSRHGTRCDRFAPCRPRRILRRNARMPLSGSGESPESPQQKRLVHRLLQDRSWLERVRALDAQV